MPNEAKFHWLRAVNISVKAYTKINKMPPSQMIITQYFNSAQNFQHRHQQQPQIHSDTSNETSSQVSSILLAYCCLSAAPICCHKQY
eukprot:10447268-Ditylum_brightwellii.AAC.1